MDVPVGSYKPHDDTMLHEKESTELSTHVNAVPSVKIS